MTDATDTTPIRTYSLLDEFRVMVAERLLSWAFSLMPCGAQKRALGTALIEYLKEIGR